MSDNQILDNQNNNNSNDTLGTPLKVVSFCVPIVGAIIYFTTDKNSFPNKRKEACNFALYGVGFGILLQVLMLVVGAGAGAR